MTRRDEIGAGEAEAFSLVEVVIALGIIAFCLVGLIGLLPVGLTTARNTQEEAAAAVAFSDLANAIRAARRDSSGSYHCAGTLDDLSWVTGGATVTGEYEMSLAGGEGGQRVRARVEIDPPAQMNVPGSALISLAWPQSAAWNTNASRWDRSQGSLVSRILFLPRP